MRQLCLPVTTYAEDLLVLLVVVVGKALHWLSGIWLVPSILLLVGALVSWPHKGSWAQLWPYGPWALAWFRP